MHIGVGERTSFKAAPRTVRAVQCVGGACSLPGKGIVVGEHHHGAAASLLGKHLRVGKFTAIEIREGDRAPQETCGLAALPSQLCQTLVAFLDHSHVNIAQAALFASTVAGSGVKHSSGESGARPASAEAPRPFPSEVMGICAGRLSRARHRHWRGQRHGHGHGRWAWAVGMGSGHGQRAWAEGSGIRIRMGSDIRIRMRHTHGAK